MAGMIILPLLYVRWGEAMLGKILKNRYKIVKNLGKGGMAIVFEAQDLLLDRKVALKMLRPEFVNDSDFVKKFRHEAKAVARLSHPNVVSIFDIGEDDEKHYLVMEKVEGRTLKDIIEERGKLSITESLDIANQICAALVVAHRNNIIHCDIKPHNVLITPDKQVKVTDFGIARAVTSSTITITDTVMGSAHYFSPEQAQGGEIKIRSDLYSLGIVLYEMLTGEVPFKGDSPISVALKHIQEEAKKPSELNKDIPSEVDRLVMKAIAKEPEDRFNSAAEMRESITRVLKGLQKPGNNKSYVLSDQGDTKILKRVRIDDKTEEKSYLTESREAGYLPRWIKWIAGLVIVFTIVTIGLFVFYKNYMGVPIVEVPDLVGMNFEKGEKVAAQVGLHLEPQPERIHHPEIPEGGIISQYPPAGERIRQTRSLTVTLSKGPAILTMPDLFNISLREAEVIINNHNLVIGEKEYLYTNEMPEGYIINQEPAPGEEINIDTNINLVISSGPSPIMISVPNLIGLYRQEALEIIKDNSLIVGEIEEELTRRFIADQVAAQEYDPGTEIPEGSKIGLTISKGLVNTEEAKIHSIFVKNIVIDPWPEDQRIEIIVNDNNGRDIVYNKVHHPGDVWTPLTINSVGSTTYEFYKNGELIKKLERS
jgi:eukaryotic-like serine/threonine-protein kinase